MKTSESFRRLLDQYILPQLNQQVLLAFPEGARSRDKYNILFSLQVLLSMERFENDLFRIFSQYNVDEDNSNGKKCTHDMCKIITVSINRLNLLNGSIEQASFMDILVSDIMPKGEPQIPSVTKSVSITKSLVDEATFMMFPQWEWILAITAFEFSENPGEHVTGTISTLIADMLMSI